MKKHTLSGFTLPELMIVVAIMGILAALALPSYQLMIEGKRLKLVVEGLKSDMQLARTMAIKRSVDINVSRTAGDAGAWCYGLSATTPSCDCNAATVVVTDDCEIKIVSGSAYSATNMLGIDGNSVFRYRRGTASNNGVTFTTANYTARVVFTVAGRVRACTTNPLTAGKTGLPEYPNC